MLQIVNMSIMSLAEQMIQWCRKVLLVSLSQINCPDPHLTKELLKLTGFGSKKDATKYRYKRSTGLDGQNIIDHLWACASDALVRRCYEAGNCDKIIEKILLQRMKKMSIRAQNKLVNIVEFLSMAQNEDEPVAQFVSRLHGQAKVCNFAIKCTAECCTADENNALYSW